MSAALATPIRDNADVEPAAPHLPWLNRFAELGKEFYTELRPLPVPTPAWVATSADCAALLGWDADWSQREDWQALQVFSGNALWPGMRPLASVYSGHQFGVWAGQLGDGRALLLGEVTTPQGPHELQLKGSGLTPYSRMGDGRAVLRSSIREFLCSEAMHALGVPTTRALCVTGSPLPVRREEVETAAVVTRVAPSFIRFGHFEHFADQGTPEQLRRLADFTIDQHYPACRGEAQPYAALLEAVTRRTALMVADWQALGFCHGVMNTDNMSILGLTIDYGPFGFLDGFDPGHICYAGHRLAPWLGHLMVSRQETARPLLTPGEVMQLPPDDAVVMVSGHPPIKAKKLRYYQDRNFTSRVLPAPVLAEGVYADRPATRPDDWSGLSPLAARMPSLAGDASGMVDEGGHQLKPELDATADAPSLPDADGLLVLDDEDDAPLRPQDVDRQLMRTARLAALDPDDGIAL